MKMNKGICAALTGGIACGKSTVAAFWRQWGVEVLDADEVAHALIEPGGPAVDAVVQAFGPELRNAAGGIDRAALAPRIFGDEPARRRLEELLHPPVIARMRAWAAAVRREGRRGAAVVPLLYEAGMDKDWDAVVCVVSSEQTILERLEQRGLSPEAARARMASQWPVREKAARADRLIENNGSLAELESRSRDIWNEVFEQGD